jgi:hypothetical protein
MRITKILSIAVGAIALTFMTPAPRASAMTTTVPAAIDAITPNNGQVEKVRTVCRRYRVYRHGRVYWRTRCYRTPNRYYRRYPSRRYHHPRPYRYYR